MIEQLASIYNGKRVFVTGHTGFKGAWMMSLLNILGAVTKGYALTPEYNDSLFSIMGKNRLQESVIADIRDRPRLAKEILNFQPEFIFHLAAQPLVRRSYRIPAETFDVNVTGTANLLEGAKALAGKCTIIVITTDKVYENDELARPFTEEDTLGGHDPYSTSKACAELVVTSFRRSFFPIGEYKIHQKTIASARAGNVIGGGDWSEDRIIPDIIRSLEKDTLIEVRNPSSIRPWQHVLEPLVGYLQLGTGMAQSPASYSSAYNFGPLPGDHLTVGDLVDRAIKIYGRGNWKDVSSLGHHHEAGLLRLDISRAMRELHWRPKLTADQALTWTIDWYKQPREDRYVFTIEQIKKYLAL